MITVAEAQAKIAALLAPVGTESVGIAQAGGRVLREAAIAKRPQPPFAASAMDGYAIRRTDLSPGAVLTVTGAVAAGETPPHGVGPGEAMRIFTGAPVPEGADFILIQEDATREGDRITIRDGHDRDAYVRPAGGDFAEGYRIEAPRRLGFADLALLAAMNVPRVQVARRPVVAIVPTGDELVWPGETPRPDQIVASNNFGLKAMLEAEGADVRLLPIARDRVEDLARVLELAAGADMIVTLGGASVGDHDLVQRVAGGQGLDLSFYKLAMRPGKPLMAGRLGRSVMVGLPGNPVSSLVCAHIFLRPAIAALQGLPYLPPETEPAHLAVAIGPNGPREHYMRASVTGLPGALSCLPHANQDSSLLTVLAGANALMVRPANEPALPEGHPVRIMRL